MRPRPSHCQDVDADRALGRFWEERFCELAAARGFHSIPHQWGNEKDAARIRGPDSNRHTLPDITIDTPPYHCHEIKHKDARWKHDDIGLEVPRFDHLLWYATYVRRRVYYTVHRWDLAPGGKHGRVNRLEDWFTAPIDILRWAYRAGLTRGGRAYGWLGGEKVLQDMIYWPAGLFLSLGIILDIEHNLSNSV